MRWGRRMMKREGSEPHHLPGLFSGGPVHNLKVTKLPGMQAGSLIVWWLVTVCQYPLNTQDPHAQRDRKRERQTSRSIYLIAIYLHVIRQETKRRPGEQNNEILAMVFSSCGPRMTTILLLKLFSIFQMSVNKHRLFL